MAMVKFTHNSSSSEVYNEVTQSDLSQTIDNDKGFCFHKWFERQVEQRPNAVAVIFKDKQLTYQQLNCRANQLAHYLQAMGVGAESLVGICMERCPEIVVGLLAILKAGGAYVPLDPAYPKERIAFIVEETQISILLTQKHLRLLDINIANTKASKSYVAQVYRGRVTLFRCKPLDNNTDFGWAKLVTGGVDVAIVPGNHTNIMEDPNIQVSAKQLNLYLQQMR